MDPVELLESKSELIVGEAVASLDRANLKRYREATAEEVRGRLEQLFLLVVRSLRERDLVPIIHHSEQVAEERFAAGYDIVEVQTAFNVLEEVIWLQVVEATPPDELADAIGMISTVLGAGKDALARTYVALASHHHVPSLDLTALFRGVD